MPYNSFSFQLTFWATSRWTPNATSLPSNTTWLTFFRPFASKYSLPCRATSCWTSIATSLPLNTTWLTFFLPFWLKLLASLPRHVVLDLHRDMAAFQYDVAPPFTPKTTRAIRVVTYLLYLNSNVQSSLKLASSKRCSGRRRGPQELEPMPACL